MTHAELEAKSEAGTFEHTCAYCGARLRVLAAPPAAAPRAPLREYECPACGKDYEVHAATEPVVRLLHGRTDGKDDRYQETMF